MTKHFITTVFLIAIAFCSFAIGQQIDLSGTWQAELLDLNQTGPATLPGSLCSNKLGKLRTKSVDGALSGRYEYVGPAVYTREFELPAEMEGKDLELFLERVNWVSTIAIDDIASNSIQTMLLTPHIHPLMKLKAGKHTISITVDNSEHVPIEQMGHTYGDSMLSLWNGIIGQIVIRVRPTIRNIQIEAPYPTKSFTVTADCDTDLSDYIFTMKDATGKEIALKVASSELHQSMGNATETGNPQQVICSFDQSVQPWSEFNPYLYQVSIQSKANPKEVYTWSIGFRTIRRDGNKAFLNDKPLSIRGNLDCGNFPYTGYPDMDKASWLKRLKIQKDNGCNTIRFHTWCPPQAAFEAANELGMYLAPETEFWSQHPGLGRGEESVDCHIHQSYNDIQDWYGNNPSMLFMTIGNELGASNFEFMSQWIKERKKMDRRHLYSESTARQVTPETEFFVTHAYPGIGWVREAMYPYTDWDYEAKYSKTAMPTAAHEIGQWPVYPSWNEIDKYTGCMRAMNLESMRETAKQKGVYKYNAELHAASAQTSALRYKDEIESFLRTPSAFGVQLLSMQDYSGQGEALVGWMDVFWDNKGFMPLEKIQGCYAPTVAMARFKKYVYTTEEKYTADVVIYRYELDDLKDETLVWKLDGTNLSGEIALPTIPNGNVTKAGTISIPLDVKSLLSESDSRINDPVWRFELVLSSKNGSFKENRYPVWVVNEKFTVTVPEDLVITDDSVTALEALKNGKRVLFNGTKAPAGKNVVTSYWRPVYWSTYFFKGQKRTLGTWHDKSVFGQITPTQFADWFFYSLVERGRYVILNGTPDFRPYGMPVCDFHSDYNDRLGSVFTASVGKGTLLYCGYDFDAQTPEAQALKNILLTNKAVWKPQVELSHEWFEKNLLPEPYIAPPRPAEYKDAEMFIYASVHVQDLNHHFDWIKSLDASELAPGYSYELHNCGSWKDDFGGFWIFNRNNATVTLKSQKQTKGKLIFVLCDSNSLGRTGKITCGWRTVEVPKHNINADRRTTVSIDLIREDWREGEITVKIEPIHGPNLQVEKMIYVPEE